MLGSDNFVRRPENCAEIGLTCSRCISEAARQLAQVSPGMRPSGAVTLFRIMFEEPSCRNMQQAFLFSYNNFNTCNPIVEFAE
jgi:hypothetical protein